MALIGKVSLNWINESSVDLNKDLWKYIHELQIKSPALEVSCRSAGFIQRFRIQDSTDTEVVFDQLMDEVSYLVGKNKNYAESADELESLLNANNLINGEFWKHCEFACYVMSGEAKKQVKKAVDEQSKNNTGLKNQKRELVQTKYQKLDSLFRHIRNSIAHGSFALMPNDRFVFQDCNAEGNVSARLVLDKSRVDRWISEFHRFENEGV